MREREIKSTLILNAKQAQKVNKQTKKKEEDASDRTRKPRNLTKKKSFQKGTSIRRRYFFFSKINILFFVIKGRQHARTEYHPGEKKKKKKRAKYAPIATTARRSFFSPHSNA